MKWAVLAIPLWRVSEAFALFLDDLQGSVLDAVHHHAPLDPSIRAETKQAGCGAKALRRGQVGDRDRINATRAHQTRRNRHRIIADRRVVARLAAIFGLEDSSANLGLYNSICESDIYAQM